MNFEKACQELVERGRLGDQNALATMIQVRENAKKGNVKAQKAHQTMLAYARYTEDEQPGMAPVKMSGNLTVKGALATLRDLIKRVGNREQYLTLVRSNVPMNGLSLRASANAAQAISQGPIITDETIAETRATFEKEEAQKAFDIALASAGDVRMLKGAPKAPEAIQMGYTMGLARRMQTVRRGGPIAVYSKIAAWELGEI